MLDDALLTATDSAVATDTSAGAGDGAAGGAGTDTATIGDGGAADTQVTDATQQTNQTTSTEDTQTQDAGTDTTTLDLGQPSPLPKELRALMADKELAANPLVAAAVKTLQSAYDRLNAYTLHFPTVGDAKKFAETFPGGLQDAVQAQQRAQQLDESDSVFYSRDPAQHRELASTWAKDDPDAFAVLTRSGLEVFAETNPEGYRQLGFDVLEQTLGVMQQAAFQRNDQEAAQRIAQTHQDIFGRKPGEQPRVDPRDRQIQDRQKQQQEREQKFQSQVAANFANESNKQAGITISQSIESVVNRALTNVRITPQAKARIVKETYDEINAKLMQDRSLDNQLKAIAQAGMRSGQFTKQQQDQWVNAIRAKARGLVQSTAQAKINEWTNDFLGMKRADTQRREQAGTRTDITGGGSPNLGVSPLTGDKILDMSDADLNAYKGPISPNWRKEMQEARLKRMSGR